MAFNFGHDRTPIGLFTEDDERREKLQISSEEIVESQTDILGIKVIPNKTEGDVANALSLMNEELSRIPLDQKRSYHDAVEKCPDEVNDEKKLAFLWREDFDAKLAAVRLVNYWEKRKKVFSERCYQPLTLRTLEHEIPLISSGLFQVLPGKDSSGRAILAYDASLRNMSANPLEEVVRASWYFFHCLIEDVETQKRGCIVLGLLRHAKYNNFDPFLMRALTGLERKCFPIRIMSLHICHPRPFFRAVLPVVKYVLGRRIRARLCFCFGSDKMVIENLNMYGISPESVPAHSGGRLVHDHTQWMCDRLHIEEQRQRGAGTSLNILAAAAVDVQEGEVHHAEKRAKRSHDYTLQKENGYTLVSRSRQASAEEPTYLSGQVQTFSSFNMASLAGITDKNQPTVNAMNQLMLNCVHTANEYQLNRSRQIPPDGQLSQQLSSMNPNSISNQVGPLSSSSMHSSNQHHQISPGYETIDNVANNRSTGAPDLMAVENLLGVLQVPSFVPNSATIASKLVRSSPDVSCKQGQASSALNTHQSLQVGPLVLPRNSQNLSQRQIPRQDQSTSLHVEESEQCFSLPRLLYIPMDEMRVSPFQCLLRKQIEVFVADEELAARTTRGRKKPIHPGQVGIRCRHCRGLPLGAAQQGAMYFPSSLVSMYQTGQKMSSVHFFSNKPCTSMPKDIVREGMTASRAGVGGGKSYWEEAGEMLGLVDTDIGIQFCPSNAQLRIKGS